MTGKLVRILLFALLLPFSACSGRPQLPQLPLPKPKPKPTPTQPSNIKAEVSPGGPAVLTTSAAEFQVRPDGYLQAFLLRGGHRLSLDEPRLGAPSDSDYAVSGGKEVHFTLDFGQARVLESIGKMGVGKRLEIPARPLGPSGTDLERLLIVEAYDRFPNLLLVAVEYKNIGTAGMRIERTVDQRHRFSAKVVAAKAQAWDLWSYQRASGGGSQGEVVKLKRNFWRRNAVEPGKGEETTELEMVAVWSEEVGEAIGHLNAVPEGAAIPVKVDSDGRVDVHLEIVANAMLMPGETYSSPGNFLAIYDGDSPQPSHLWTALPPRESREALEPQSPIR